MEAHDDVIEEARFTGDGREYVVRGPLFEAVRERWERERAAALTRGAAIVAERCGWIAEGAYAYLVTRDEPARQLSAMATPHPRLSPPRRGHLRLLPPGDREGAA